MPLTLRATIVDRAGKPLYPEGTRQYTRAITTGADRDTDNYALKIPWFDFAVMGNACFARLDVIDNSGKALCTYSENVDLFTDLQRR